jgi:hypothetical protein
MVEIPVQKDVREKIKKKGIETYSNFLGKILSIYDNSCPQNITGMGHDYSRTKKVCHNG